MSDVQNGQPRGEPAQDEHARDKRAAQDEQPQDERAQGKQAAQDEQTAQDEHARDGEIREIAFAFAPPPKVKVGGKVFCLRLDEAEVFDRAIALSQRAKELLLPETTAAMVLLALRESVALIDEMLGEGAAKEIAGGRPVSMADQLVLTAEILNAACKGYANRVAAYDE